jgi:hypothetical protein
MIRVRCATKASMRSASGPVVGSGWKRVIRRSNCFSAAALKRSSRSSKCTYTDRSDTPAWSAISRAVGRRLPSSLSARRASTTASRVRAARAERPSV